MSLNNRTPLTFLEFQGKQKMFETAGVQNNGNKKQTNKFIRLIAVTVNFYLRDAQLFPFYAKVPCILGLTGQLRFFEIIQRELKIAGTKGK